MTQANVLLDGLDLGDGFGTDGSQYLTFRLGNECYGLPILAVQEIKSYVEPTPVPHAPHWVTGIINLRGTVVPVVDLRRRFSLRAADIEKTTVVIVVQLDGRLAGLVVDAVSDVIAIAPGDIQPPPALGAAVDATCLCGLSTTGDQFVLLLDVARLIETGLDIPSGI